MAFARPANEALPLGNYRAQTRDDVKIKIIGGCILGAILLLGFGLFFGIRHPDHFVFGC